MPAPEVLDLSYLSNPNADRLERLGFQLWRRMAGGNVTADSPYTLTECQLALEEYRGKRQAEINQFNADKQVAFAIQALAYYKQQYFEDMESLYKYGGTTDAWIKTFTLQVFTDADRGLKYVLLPAIFVTQPRYRYLPGEEVVKLVERAKWNANLNFAPRFIPFAHGAHRVFAGLYKAGIQGNYGYFRDADGQGGEPDRLYFWHEFETPTFVDDKLRVSVVLRPERDGLPEPGLMADVADMDMVMGAEAILMRRGPEDRASDNIAPAQVQAA